MVPRQVEICVVGGGPAGATVARRLAQLGHRVLVLEKAAMPRPHIGESLPPTILPLLEVLGIRSRIEQAGFLRPGGARIRWAGTSRHQATDGGEPGFQVDRGRFDSLLLAAAAEAGAGVHHPAHVRSARRQRDGWQIEVALGTARRQLTCHYLIDATGRHGVLRRRRRRKLSAPTLALYGYWRHTGLEGAETRIEAADRAWLWGAPLPDGSVNAAVFIDPKGQRPGGLDLEAFYLRLLERSELLAGCLEGQLIAPVKACDATSQLSPDPIFERGLRVGESCLTLDPLSSQGVQAAIRSALQAAAVAHTQLRYPSDAAAAARFYRQRVAETAERHRMMAESFYAAEAAAREAPSDFWRSRAGSRRNELSRPPRPPGMPQPEAAVRLGEGARLVATPVLLGDRIVSRPALTHPRLERPLALVSGHEISPLLGDLGSATVREIIQGWHRRLGSTAVARRLFGYLWQRQVLVQIPQRTMVSNA